MPPNWRWCLNIGALIVLIDLVIVTLGRQQPPDSDVVALLDTVDQIANVALFALVGFRVGQATARATAAAEAGVLTSLLPAAAAAAYVLLGLGTAPSEAGAPSLLNQVIFIVAYNIVLGGLTALVAGWIASRARSASGR